jgi:hypothetical protein
MIEGQEQTRSNLAREENVTLVERAAEHASYEVARHRHRIDTFEVVADVRARCGFGYRSSFFVLRSSFFVLRDRSVQPNARSRRGAVFKP